MEPVHLTDVNLVRETGLDQFYTIPSCSKICIDKMNELYDITNFDLMVEPSAGNGSFLIKLYIQVKLVLTLLLNTLLLFNKISLVIILRLVKQKLVLLVTLHSVKIHH